MTNRTNSSDPKQVTPKGKEIPVPKRKEVLDFFKGVTGKRTHAAGDRNDAVDAQGPPASDSTP